MATLNDLLTSLREADDGIVMLSKEELQEALGGIKDKVDNTYEVLDRLGSDSLRMGKLAKSFMDRKRTVDNQIKRLKEYVLYSMEQDGTTELSGEVHRLKIHKRASMKYAEAEIDPGMFLKFPEVIKREYSLEKNVLKEKYKADPERYAELVEPVYKSHIKFTVK